MTQVEHKKTKLAISLALFSFVLYSLNDVITKLIASEGGVLHNTVAFHPLQLSFITAVVGVFVFSIIGLSRGGIYAFKIKRASFRWILIRAILAVVNGYVVIYSFAHFPMTEVYTMIFATPILVTVLAIPFLGEKVGWRRWSATAVGFIGVVLAAHPSADMLANPERLIPLTIALLGAAAMIVTMKAIAVERSTTVAFWNNILVVGILTIPAIMLWEPVSIWQLALSVLTGTIAGIAFYFMLTANGYAPASQIAPLQYSQFIWGLLFDFIIFKKAPESILTYIGAAIIILSGIYTLERKRKVRRTRFIPRYKRYLWFGKKPTLSGRAALRPKQPQKDA